MQDLQAKQAQQEQLIQGLHTDVARYAQHCMAIRSDPSSCGYVHKISICPFCLVECDVSDRPSAYAECCCFAES